MRSRIRLPSRVTKRISAIGAGSFYGFKDPQNLFDAIKGYADDAQKLSDAKGAARLLFEEYFNREKTYPAFAAWVRGGWRIGGAPPQ
jgi:hypothetical protein